MESRDFKDINVMVVDDDPFVLTTVSLTLGSLGVEEILHAATGLEALQLLDGYEGHIDLVICDLEMPEIDGMELMRSLADVDSTCNVLLCSGHDEDILQSARKFAASLGLRELGAHKKPLKRETLIRALERVERPTIIRRRNEMSIDEDGVRQGIASGAIDVFFQPKIRLTDFSISGFEALMRWRSGDTYLPPFPIIQVAEQSGQIRDLTNAVIARTFEYLDSDHELPLPVSINVSADDFVGRDLVHLLKRTCELVQVPSDSITVELTETLLDDERISMENVTRLRLNGFIPSIDDYGTGTSNLSRLAKLPFKELKLDREFINNAQESNKYMAVLENTVKLASEIGVKCVGEGVETFEQLFLLKRLGCHEAQGYLIAKPMPYAELKHFIHTWPKPGFLEAAESVA